MKTSELKQIVEEHGYTFQKTDQFILNENLQQNVARDFI